MEQQIVKLTEKHIAVVVPEQYKNFVIKNYGFAGYWLMETDSKELNHWKVFLSKGKCSYTFLFLSSQATEEDAKRVVECFSSKIGWRLDGDETKLPDLKMYMNYKYEKPVPVTFLFTNALESFHSLLRSKGITSPCAILEINN